MSRNSMLHRFLPACVLLLALAGARVESQEAIPSNPAVTFIGASPTEISRPATAAGLAGDLLNSIDREGNVKQGLALDFTPWWVIPGLRIPLQDYQERRGKYILANTQISLATAKSSGDDNDTDLGLGLRTVFFDDADFMKSRKFIAELDRRRQECEPPDQPEDLGAYEECLDRVFLEWREQWLDQRRPWNRSALAMALATSLQLGGSQIDNAEWSGIGVWMTGALRLARWGQLGGQVEYDYRMQGSGESLNHFLGAGVRGLAGGPSFAVSVEYWGRMNLSGPNGDRYSDRLTVAVEYRIGENTWLSSGMSGSIAETGEGLSLLSSLRWEILSGPTLIPPAEQTSTPEGNDS
jgi:hypothetical protein